MVIIYSKIKTFRVSKILNVGGFRLKQGGAAQQPQISVR